MGLHATIMNLVSLVPFFDRLLVGVPFFHLGDTPSQRPNMAPTNPSTSAIQDTEFKVAPLSTLERFTIIDVLVKLEYYESCIILQQWKHGHQTYHGKSDRE